MTVPSPLLPTRIFSRFPGGLSTSTLPDECRALLNEQRSVWPQASDGYASLDTVRVRKVECRGFNAYLQFNPKRIVSTGAKVDPKSIRERKCFLCLENLPEPQKGILYHGDHLILCNPVPIFRQHFTISSIRHIPQTLDGHAGTMLALARDLSPSFSVFYNGPRCGASAPDHMHFQSCPAGAIPVEQEAADHRRRQQRVSVHGVPVFVMEEFGREVFVLESADRASMEKAMAALIGAMQSALGGTEEPMMNVIASWKDGLWRVLVFPRRKHRPDAYFRKGEERILISPAAVDIGGFIVTPLQTDFERVDAAMIESIFREVSVRRDEVERICSFLQ